jgi:signal transduction histidine kinase
VGLGLHIAQRIAEAHQATIEAESVVGQGSTFRLTLHAV